MAVKKTTKKAAPKAEVLKKSTGVVSVAASTIIRKPRVTEKAAYAGEQSVYTFEVAIHANKTEIKKAIKALYGVTPIKVATILMKKQRTFARGRIGATKAFKKAMVYLAKGQTIEFI